MHPCSKHWGMTIEKTFPETMSWLFKIIYRLNVNSVHGNSTSVLVCFTPLSIHRVYITADHFVKHSVAVKSPWIYSYLCVLYSNSQRLKTCLTGEPAVAFFGSNADTKQFVLKSLTGQCFQMLMGTLYIWELRVGCETTTIKMQEATKFPFCL